MHYVRLGFISADNFSTEPGGQQYAALYLGALVVQVLGHVSQRITDLHAEGYVHRDLNICWPMLLLRSTYMFLCLFTIAQQCS